MKDGGKICETKEPVWQENENGHKIFCHIPIDILAEGDPVVYKEPAQGD